MNCSETRKQLSCYVDGDLDWKAESQLRRHLEACAVCTEQAVQLEAVRSLVRQHGRVEPPADLALQIKLAVSRRVQLNLWDRLNVRLDNFLRPLALPAAAGLVAAFLTFGVLIQTFVNRPVLTEDVPLALTTPPRLRLAPPITFNTTDDGLSVMTNVDNEGRIIDYRVLNGPRDPHQLSELRQVLVFTQFEPATLFGKPTSGRIIINFRRISVKG